MNDHCKKRSDCPVSFTLDLLGDKWTLLIIRDMIFYDKKFYRDFLGSEEKIATNILANRLKNLQKAGLVVRSKDADKKTQYIYGLTDKGLDLLPIVLQMVLWGAKYDPKTAAPKDFIHRLKKDLKLVASELRESVIRRRQP